ncbi:MAG: VCBS repeat-containing protein [Deltaproteobacteria bacterium]|nr:VCBS repeat-containing protein [Deltaproteobacteria bacterium]
MILLIPMIALLMPVTHSVAKAPKKVAVLPFKMNADKDLTFLQEGIMDMISSRLAWKGEVELLEKDVVKKEVAGIKGGLNKENAIDVGKALHVDYVIIGSLTVFGESVSIDARILNVSKGEELITAFNQSRGMDEVIPTVNQFAQDINAKILGRQVRPQTYPVGGSEREVGPGGLIPVGGDTWEQKFAHTQTFNYEIRGVDSGDIDGDGKNELIVLSNDTVYIYRWTEKSFALFKSLKGSWTPDYVYLSVADLDNNGKAEIYVSGQIQSDASSMILEYRSGQLTPVIDRERQFLRVVDLPGRGETLLGQTRVSDGFSRYVYILKRDGDNLIRQETLNLPSMANIFNFVQGSIAYGNSVQTLVLNTETNILFMFNDKGEEIWRSDEEFGGTVTYMAVPSTTRNVERWIYYPPPIFLSDTDKDGRKEVVIAKNGAGLSRYAEKARFFSVGKLHLLLWSGSALSTRWETRDIAGGPITGYCIKDVDNDNQPEIVISALKQSARVGRSPKSELVLMDLE